MRYGINTRRGTPVEITRVPAAPAVLLGRAIGRLVRILRSPAGTTAAHLPEPTRDGRPHAHRTRITG